jgi:hypothetical protein
MGSPYPSLSTLTPCFPRRLDDSSCSNSGIGFAVSEQTVEPYGNFPWDQRLKRTRSESSDNFCPELAAPAKDSQRLFLRTPPSLRARITIILRPTNVKNPSGRSPGCLILPSRVSSEKSNQIFHPRPRSYWDTSLPVTDRGNFLRRSWEKNRSARIYWPGRSIA